MNYKLKTYGYSYGSTSIWYYYYYYWINRRKFYRRNALGAEGFSSFESSVFIRLIERIGKWLAYALIIVGIICFWTYAQMKKDKENKQSEVKTEQPAQR